MSPGKLVTEMVPRSRLSPAKLDSAAQEKVFAMAMHAMSNPIPATIPSGDKVEQEMKKSQKSKHCRDTGRLSDDTRTLSDENMMLEERESTVQELVAVGCEMQQAEALNAAVELLVGGKIDSPNQNRGKPAAGEEIA